MSSLALSLTICLAAFLLSTVGLWFLVPIFAGLPWRPSPTPRIYRALALAQVHPGERVYDLGAGDGRLLRVAAQEFAAQGVGIEISPVHCLLAWVFIQCQHLGHQIRIRWGDVYNSDLTEADVVLAYMTSRQATRLQAHLERQLRPGTRVVTLAFELDGWQPLAIDSDQLLYLYRMPPESGNLGSFLAQKAGLTLNEVDHLKRIGSS